MAESFAHVPNPMPQHCPFVPLAPIGEVMKEAKTEAVTETPKKRASKREARAPRRRSAPKPDDGPKISPHQLLDTHDIDSARDQADVCWALLRNNRFALFYAALAVRQSTETLTKSLTAGVLAREATDDKTMQRKQHAREVIARLAECASEAAAVVAALRSEQAAILRKPAGDWTMIDELMVKEKFMPFSRPFSYSGMI